MGVIWYAIGIYIVGVAVVLFIRPSAMFRPGGTWKEFGLSSEGNYTVFPFWMFSLVWAVFSFAIANMFQGFFATTVLRSLPAANAVPLSNIIQPISSAPPPAVPAVEQRLPGYYVLESAIRGVPEQPRYVFWGPEPPTAANLK